MLKYFNNISLRIRIFIAMILLIFLATVLIIGVTIYQGRARFRAIFLTSITTVAGLAPLIFEESRQAQFLIPMAISIAYGIGFATVLTLIVLPIFLSFSNNVKTTLKWLQTGNRISKEEVERVTRE